MSISILGIKAGPSCAAAFYFPQADAVVAYDIRRVGGETDAGGLFELIKLFAPDCAVQECLSLESVFDPEQAFLIGSAHGLTRGILLAAKVAVHLVDPADVIRHFALTAEGHASARALAIWPRDAAQFASPNDEAKAAAALVARYANERILRPRRSFRSVAVSSDSELLITN